MAGKQNKVRHEGLADVELRSAIEPILKNDPIARLGYLVAQQRGYDINAYAQNPRAVMNIAGQYAPPGAENLFAEKLAKQGVKDDPSKHRINYATGMNTAAGAGLLKEHPDARRERTEDMVTLAHELRHAGMEYLRERGDVQDPFSSKEEAFVGSRDKALVGAAQKERIPGYDTSKLPSERTRDTLRNKFDANEINALADERLRQLGAPPVAPYQEPSFLGDIKNYFRSGDLMQEQPRHAGTAAELASKGRYGDTMLVHMNPIEVDALSKMSPTGQLTINPDTGQPEAFLPLLAAMAASWMAPVGWGAAAAGLGSFAGSLAQGDDFDKALMGGVMSFGLGSVLNAAGGLSDAATSATSATGGLNDIGATGFMGEHANEFAGLASQANTVTPYAGVGGFAPGANNIGATASMGPDDINAFADDLGSGYAPQANTVAPYPPNVGAPRTGGGFQDFGKSAIDKWNALPPAVGPETVNPAYDKMDLTDKFGYLKKQGWGQSFNNAVTGNPIGTAALGVGAMGGGLDTFVDGPQYDIPTNQLGKSYPSRPYKTSGVKRNFVGDPEGYRPGIDPERSYLDPIGTYQGFADGGKIAPLQELQPESPDQALLMQQLQQNPIIMGAVAAITGQHPEPQKAIQAFIQKYGPEKFSELRQQVIAEQSVAQRSASGLGGMIQGPGTGTSDSIPAQITQGGQPVEEIRVANGEYIMPKATVDKLGESNLDQIVAATNGRPANR
jgi:hypothetical protein